MSRVPFGQFYSKRLLPNGIYVVFIQSPATPHTPLRMPYM